LRERAGLSLKQLAETVGTSEYDLAAWERGMAQPPTAMVLLLAGALGVSGTQLMTGHPEADRKPTIRLTADNFADLLPTTYATSLVKGLTVPEDGFNIDHPIVSKLLAWVDLQSGRSADVRYEMSPLVAAVFLERLAGPRDGGAGP
jgi:transcriptional regulator with XRE-family HTH domain